MLNLSCSQNLMGQHFKIKVNFSQFLGNSFHVNAAKPKVPNLFWPDFLVLHLGRVVKLHDLPQMRPLSIIMASFLA